MPSLSLPSGENEREGGLSLFKMHKAEHPMEAQFTAGPNSRSGASPGRAPEHAVFRHLRDAGHSRLSPQSHAGPWKHLSFTQHFLKSASPLPRCPPSKRKTQQHRFFHHNHSNQHILCHQGRVTICNMSAGARSKVFPELVYHGMFDSSILPYILSLPPPAPHPWGSLCVGALLPSALLLTQPTLPPLNLSAPLPPVPCLTIVLLMQHNTASPTPQAFFLHVDLLYLRKICADQSQKGKS